MVLINAILTFLTQRRLNGKVDRIKSTMRIDRFDHVAAAGGTTAAKRQVQLCVLRNFRLDDTKKHQK